MCSLVLRLGGALSGHPDPDWPPKLDKFFPIIVVVFTFLASADLGQDKCNSLALIAWPPQAARRVLFFSRARLVCAQPVSILLLIELWRNRVGGA